jgi:hypothetical protein
MNRAVLTRRLRDFEKRLNSIFRRQYERKKATTAGSDLDVAY